VQEERRAERARLEGDTLLAKEQATKLQLTVDSLRDKLMRQAVTDREKLDRERQDEAARKRLEKESKS